MLVNLKEITDLAEKKGIAAGAFNATNLECMQAVLAAAEALKLPVILNHASVHEPINDIDTIAPIALMLADKARVPVCVNLDHGTDPAYVYKAIRLGFTSVMYDGSALPYAENLENTRKVVEFAHGAGVSVEAELGHVMTLADGAPIAEKGSADPRDFFTRPEEAAAFVAAAGVDALAVAFGTVHGFYTAAPVLDFEVVRAVRRATGGLPLVMHGGSGVSKDDYRKAVRAGIRKINYYTYMAGKGYAAAKKLADADVTRYYHDIAVAAREAMRSDVYDVMKTFAFLD